MKKKNSKRHDCIGWLAGLSRLGQGNSFVQINRKVSEGKVDSGGQSQDIKVSTVEPLQTDPDILYSAPDETSDASIFDGTGPFKVETDTGSVSQPQYFPTAGVGQSMVIVTDAQENTVRLYVTVSLKLTISPSHVYLKPGQQTEFQGSFGSGSYSFTWTEGDGVVADPLSRGSDGANISNSSNTPAVLLYTAPLKIGTHTITVFDSGGNIGKAEVVVSGGTGLE